MIVGAGTWPGRIVCALRGHYQPASYITVGDKVRGRVCRRCGRVEFLGPVTVEPLRRDRQDEWMLAGIAERTS